MAFLLTVIPISSSRCSASLPVTPERRDVDEHQVVVRAARHDPGAQPGQRLGHDPGVLDRPSLILAEGLALGQLERDGLAGDDVHQRPALRAREHVPIDRRGQRALGGAALDRRVTGRVDR